MSRSDAPMPVLWRDRKTDGAVGEVRGPRKNESTPTPRVSFWWPMRGRWWWAGLCAVSLALVGALLGWLTATVKYEATGRIETRLLQTGLPGEAVAGTTLVAGKLDSEAVRVTELTEYPDAVRIAVTPPTGLTVRATASRRDAATDLLKSTLERYEQASPLHAEVEAAQDAAQLLAQRRQHRAALDEAERRIGQLQLNDDGVTLGAALDAAQRGLHQRQTKLEQIEGWLQQSESLAVSRQTAMVVLAETDPAFAELLIERTDLLLDLVSILHGESDENGAELRDRWVALQAQIDAMADDTAVMPASWVGAPQDEQRLVAVRRSALRDQRAEVRGEVEQLRQRVADLGARQGQLQDEQAKKRDAERALRQLESEYLKLKTPAVVLELVEARVTEPAAAPVADDRLERILTGGALGGLLGFLGVVAWAFADNRWRRADPEPWTVREAPLVGVVPDVNTAPGSGEQSPTDEESRLMQRDLSRLADAVHAIRAVVEAQLREDAAQTICIASASKASGKTSLTVGLASSLVMGGMRVLVVDASLTDRTARPRTGPSLDDAADTGQSLDEVMIGMDYLDAEDRDLLAFPDGETVGLGAYLRGATLEESIIRTRVPGLALLSGVGVQPGDAGRLSRPFLQQMAMEAREHYDAVLFDTGSIPRCVEALFVAGSCNGVLLVVGHGEKRRAIDHALERLRLVGARVIGTVFNRDRAKPDAAADFDSGGTIDPSWRDQGSGMFAAAIHTHGGQGDAYDAPRGQTGLFQGVAKTAARTAAASSTAATTRSASDDSGAATETTAEEAAGASAGPIDFRPAGGAPHELSSDTWTGGLEVEPEDLHTEATPGDGVIDEYIDSVLNAAGDPGGSSVAGGAGGSPEDSKQGTPSPQARDASDA